MKNKKLWIILGIVIIAAVIVFIGVRYEETPQNTEYPKISTDLYPLYENAEWNTPAYENITIGTTIYSGVSVSSVPVVNTMDPASIFNPFENYYDQKLKSLGWTEANDLAAGGHVGGQTGYRKGDAVILTRFQINYHVVSDTAPSECPCDVTLSVFSSN